jgi:RimJ/RimL family protein N-acetyltransferase
MIAEPIQTDRLILLPISAEYADEMADVLADPAVYAFTGGSPPTAADLRARYKRWMAGSGDPALSWCNWVIRLRDQGCLAGWVQATVSPDQAEVAWVVGTAWQGRGIATEAARGLVGWLGQRQVRTVIAHIHPDHVASAAVAAAIGLAPTGTLHDGEQLWRRGA